MVSVPDQALPLIAKEFSYTAEELVQLYGVSFSWAAHALKVVWIAVIPVVIFGVQFENTNWACLGLILTVAVLAGGLYYPSWRRRQMRRAHQRAEAEDRLPRQRFECDVVFVTLEERGLAAKLRLDALLGVTQGDTFLFLYRARGSFTALPRRIFEGDEERRFLEILAVNKVKVRSRHFR